MEYLFASFGILLAVLVSLGSSESLVLPPLKYPNNFLTNTEASSAGISSRHIGRFPGTNNLLITGKTDPKVKVTSLPSPIHSMPSVENMPCTTAEISPDAAQRNSQFGMKTICRCDEIWYRKGANSSTPADSSTIKFGQVTGGIQWNDGVWTKMSVELIEAGVCDLAPCCSLYSFPVLNNSGPGHRAGTIEGMADSSELPAPPTHATAYTAIACAAMILLIAGLAGSIVFCWWKRKCSASTKSPPTTEVIDDDDDED